MNKIIVIALFEDQRYALPQTARNGSGMSDCASLVGSDGHFIVCADDEDAQLQTKELVDGIEIELSSKRSRSSRTSTC